MSEFPLPASQISQAASELLPLAVDQWPPGMLDHRAGIIPTMSRAVLWPESTDDVVRTVDWARQTKTPIVPYGAGSGVVGGAWADAGGITLDFKRMRHVKDLGHDHIVVEPGMLGIHLEQHVRQRGMTLGHFPSSIICSSAGGWVAGRSAGQFSSRYGKIEDMILSLEIVDGNSGKRRIGDDMPYVVGSEGTLALVTEADLRLWPLAEAEHYWGFTVHGVAHGLRVMREILAAGYAPSVLRLYDEFDSRVAKKNVDGGKHASPEWWRALKQRSLAVALTFPSALRLGTDALPESCMLIVGCEGGERLSRLQMEGMRSLAQKHGALDLGAGPGQAWYHGRYHVSYKQSPVFILGGYVDTMEVSGPWSSIEKIYDDVRNALSDHAFIMAHFSHAYLDGAAVYFTFAARSPLDEREHYAETWRRASAAAVGAGASVSHHHGIGRGKRDFLAEHHGPLWADYAKLKQRFDPDNVLNPGLWS